MIFLGDLVDRGPTSSACCASRWGWWHPVRLSPCGATTRAKLVRALRGARVTPTHGLAETLAQLAGETAEFREGVATFCYDLVSHLVLDDGRLVVAHAGLKEQYQGRASGRVRALRPLRRDDRRDRRVRPPRALPWARTYRGSAVVLYGHTPVPRVEWINNTACLDTGWCSGGAAPERHAVSRARGRLGPRGARLVRARRRSSPTRPSARRACCSSPSAGQGGRRDGHHRPREHHRAADGGRSRDDEPLGDRPPMADLPAADDCRPRDVGTRGVPRAPRRGVRRVPRSRRHRCHLRGEAHGVPGGRADRARPVPASARRWVARRHPHPDGRAFFAPDVEGAMLADLDGALERAGVWAELDADWVLLDGGSCPGRPRGDLIRDLFASVGAAGAAATTRRRRCWSGPWHPGSTSTGSRDRMRVRGRRVERFRDAYRRYGRHRGCPCASRRFRCSPRGRRRSRRATTAGTCRARPLGDAAPDLVIRTRAPARRPSPTPTPRRDGPRWWEQLTAEGGEGMVVKPFAGLTRTKKGLVQRGSRCAVASTCASSTARDYTVPENLERLRDRDGGEKALAGRAGVRLGLEALRRVTTGEPLMARARGRVRGAGAGVGASRPAVVSGVSVYLSARHELPYRRSGSVRPGTRARRREDARAHLVRVGAERPRPSRRRRPRMS